MFLSTSSLLVWVKQEKPALLNMFNNVKRQNSVYLCTCIIQKKDELELSFQILEMHIQNVWWTKKIYILRC